MDQCLLTVQKLLRIDIFSDHLSVPVSVLNKTRCWTLSCCRQIARKKYLEILPIYTCLESELKLMELWSLLRKKGFGVTLLIHKCYFQSLRLRAFAVLQGEASKQEPSVQLKGKSNFQGFDCCRMRLHPPPSRLPPMSLDVVTSPVYSPAPSPNY